MLPLQTQSDDVVITCDVPHHSLCAHHLLRHFSRQPQLQERLCAQLADNIYEALSQAAVGVWLTARQMCVEMRGAKSSGRFETRAWRGPSQADSLIVSAEQVSSPARQKPLPHVAARRRQRAQRALNPIGRALCWGDDAAVRSAPP